MRVRTRGRRRGKRRQGRGRKRRQGRERRRSDFSIVHFSVIIQCTTVIPCRTCLIFFILTELLKQS